MRISIEHVTRYRYDREARYSVQALRLTPSSFDGQTVLEWQTVAEPAGHLVGCRDGFDNPIQLMTVNGPHGELVIRACGVVDVSDRNGVVQGLAESAPLRLYLRRTPLTMPDEAIIALARKTEGLGSIARLHALMNLIRDRVDYRIGETGAETTASAALERGLGVCQDHAHIFISAARAAGIPARYVTGYLLLDDVQVAQANHAWAEAWVDGLGWVGFDIANRLCPTDRYVRLAAALDAFHAAPIRGLQRGGHTEQLDVEVNVQQHGHQQSQSQQ